MKTPAEYSRARSARNLHAAAEGLRELADKMDRVAHDVDAGEVKSAAYATSQVLHMHAVWLMNAKLDAVVTSAAEADVFAASEVH